MEKHPHLLVRWLAGALFALALPGFLPAAPNPAQNRLDQLAAAARKEGELTVICLPHDWVNYGEILERFAARYGVRINELNPDGSSADELEAIRLHRNSRGRQAPDVVDVGLSFGPAAKAEGLLAPYKVLTWDTIPATLKDPEGCWYGDFYGVMAFEVNRDLVNNPPRDWSDLLLPAYRGQVALSGDPRVAYQASMAVCAAALAAGGSFENLQPGLEFFRKLNDVGNFVPIAGSPGTVASGETPIILRWDYNALANRDKSAGNPHIEVVIPRSGVVAGLYVQAISAFAPHPSAARLWMEYLYSDEGQLLWLKGYGHPVRFQDLAQRNQIPPALAAALPPAAAYAKALFPSLERQNAAARFITDHWDKVVAVTLQKH